MAHLEEAGWRKQKPKKVLNRIQCFMLYIITFTQAKEITDMDLKAVFRLVDVDKSGSISRTVSARLTQCKSYTHDKTIIFKGGKDGS